MAFARDSYTASAAQTDFTITFPYLDAVDVNVYKDGVLMTNQADADTVSYQIVSTTIVRFGAGLTGGEVVVIQRATSQTSRLVDYATASTLTEEDLDNDSLQAFYMAQESIDIANTALGLGSDDNWDATTKLIKNVTDPVADQDAATKKFVDDSIADAELGVLTTPLSVANGGTASTTAAAARTALSAQEDVITTRGDLVYGNATPVAARLPIGAANRVLRSDGTDVAWGQVATADLAAGTDGELITWDASGNPATVSVGTSGQVLTSNGAGAAPTFQDVAVGWVSPAEDATGWTVHETDHNVGTGLDGEEFTSDFPALSTFNELVIKVTGLSSNGINAMRGAFTGTVGQLYDYHNLDTGIVADAVAAIFYHSDSATDTVTAILYARKMLDGFWEVWSATRTADGNDSCYVRGCLYAADSISDLNFAFTGGGTDEPDAGLMTGWYR